MLYIERGPDGTIVAIHNSATPNAQEQKPLTDDEVTLFLSKTDSWKKLIALSDLTTVRILEDLIDLLIKKNIIQFTELPLPAQERLTERKNIREHLYESNELLVDDIM